MNASTIATYGSAYCIIDTDNLFVGTTLEDELLLLGAGENVLADIREDCARLGLQVDAGRKLASYSGGEQAIIGCLTLMRLLPREPLRILLVHVLETLSPRNRQLLLRRFDSVLPAARLFTLEAGAPREANRDA